MGLGAEGNLNGGNEGCPIRATASRAHGPLRWAGLGMQQGRSRSKCACCCQPLWRVGERRFTGGGSIAPRHASRRSSSPA